MTLTGPPGIGKTRLSLAVAAALQQDLEHGVLFVPLAPLSDPSLVAPTIIAGLGIAATPGQAPEATLVSYLQDKQMLLLLDNFEQVAEAAPMLSELLAACPLLKVLVTSRALLHLYGEHEFPVPPLDVPDLEGLPPTAELPRCAAVALFVQRAQAVKPDFAITPENAPAVAEICVRLDGLPLAIELAAARVKLFTPQAMLPRLEHRLHLLTGGPHDKAPRQRTLRGAIDWSYSLLDDGERTLFQRLGVFVGGFTIEDAQSVCDIGGEAGSVDIPTAIESLLNKSLLRYQLPRISEGAGKGSEPRFLMLETIREYALERLEEGKEAGVVRDKHAGHYLTLVERDGSGLAGPQLVRLSAEHDNIRAALRWSLDRGDAAAAARMCMVLWRFWWIRGHLAEGRRWMERVLGSSIGAPLPPDLECQVLNGAGWLALGQCDIERASALLNRGLDLARSLGDDRLIASALNNLSNLAVYRGDYELAEARDGEALALYQRLGSERDIADSNCNLGVDALYRGDLERAAEFTEKSLALQRAMGEQWKIALALGNLAHVVRRQGDLARATNLCDESIALFRELGDKWGMPLTLLCLGDIARCGRDFTRARALYREASDLLNTMGNAHYIGLNLVGLAFLALAEGHAEKATTLFGALERLREVASTTPVPPADRAEYDRALAVARTQLGEAAFTAAWARGRAMPLEQAIAYALEANAPD
jgi:predicted ATPase